MKAEVSVLAALLLAIAPAAAQDGHEGHGDGPAMAAAWVDGSLCEADPAAPLAVLGTHLSFATNATHVAMRAHGHRGFAAFGAATGETVRTLIAMQEADMAIHELAAAVQGSGGLVGRTGEAGIPTPAGPPPPGHEGMHHPMETQFAYDGPSAALACVTPQGWLLVALERAAIPDGREWHVLAALDPIEQFLPHPIETTANATFRVVAAQPGEDALALQASLADPGGGGRGSPQAPALLLACAVAALAALVRARDA